MAQGDTVTIDIGEQVEAVFQLDFKRAEVNRRPDKDKFAEVNFAMRVEARKFTHTTHSEDRDTSHASPAFVKVVSDDQVLRIVFSFVTAPNELPPDGQPRFRPGEKVDLFCFYQSAGFDAADMERILLGSVTIKDPKAPANA